MKFTIDPEFRTHLRKLTKTERARLEASIEYKGCEPGSIHVARIGDAPPGDPPVLIDGHNTVEICREKKKPLCEPIVHELANREAVLEWMEWRQEARRNASQEDIEAARQKRIPRVVEAKQDGMSNRAIAEKEGVSESTVRADLKKATAQGCAVEPESGKIQGKDGKERPAHPKQSSFCDRCQRVGPVKGCPACAALKSAGKPSGKPSANGKPKAPKPGSIKFDWNASDKAFGTVARWPDALAAAYPGEKQSTEYKRIIDLLTEVAEVRKAWHKRLKKIKE